MNAKNKQKYIDVLSERKECLRHRKRRESKKFSKYSKRSECDNPHRQARATGFEIFSSVVHRDVCWRDSVAFPVGFIQIVLGLRSIGRSERATELTAPMLVFAAVLCGAACGSTIGLAQWLVCARRSNPSARGSLQRLRLCLDWRLPLIAGLLQPVWLNWAFTLIINGKTHWLARVEPSGLLHRACWRNNVDVFGIALGYVQWLAFSRTRRSCGVVDCVTRWAGCW